MSINTKIYVLHAECKISKSEPYVPRTNKLNDSRRKIDLQSQG